MFIKRLWTLGLLGLLGCVGQLQGYSYSLAPPPVVEGGWYRPNVSTTWQLQLQGEVNPRYQVQLYIIDLFDSPESLLRQLQSEGKRVICYFSAGSFEPWRPDAAEFLGAERGKPVAGFEEERWLDIRSSNVHRILLKRMDLAVQKRCDGVDPDNVDGYANDTGFDLSFDDQLAFNRSIANEAHARGLAVSLKNDSDQVGALLAYVDFSVNEQCHAFEECSLLAPFIAAGKPVFNVEYEARYVQGATVRERLCQEALAQNLRTLILPRELDDAFRFSCDE